MAFDPICTLPDEKSRQTLCEPWTNGRARLVKETREELMLLVVRKLSQMETL